MRGNLRCATLAVIVTTSAAGCRPSRSDPLLELAPPLSESPTDEQSVSKVEPSLHGDLPAAWWTPVPQISREQLVPAGEEAVRACVGVYRVQAIDVTAAELFAAAKCFNEHGVYAEEVRVYLYLLERFPSSEHEPAALATLGRRFEQLDRRWRAVETYRTYLRKFPRRDEARVLAQRAVCLARSLHDTDAAREILVDLERLYRRTGFVWPPEQAFGQLCGGLTDVPR